MFRKTLGSYGEFLARNILEAQGYLILETRFQTRYGEIDLIAEHQGQLVFIEVKTRIGNAFGSGLEAITWRKRRSLIRAALCYLQRKNYRDCPCRFDILALTLNQQGEHLSHELITNAFGVEGGNYY